MISVGPRTVSRRRFLAGAAIGALGAVVAPPPCVHGSPFEFSFVPHAPLTALDPVWTPAHTTRNHGYMIYDTLFGIDGAGRIQPQMIDRYVELESGLRWSFTLREGLQWHDGHPVTAEDCVVSIARWSRKDPFGQLLSRHTRRLVPLDTRTFVVDLVEPFPLLLQALARPASHVPFMMPARIAATSADEQIKEHVGSGPFRLDELAPGVAAIYSRNGDYRPRPERPTGSAGGKHARLARVIWRFHHGPEAARDSLLRGDIDWWERPPLAMLSELGRSPDVVIAVADPIGAQGWLLPNHLHPPFDRKEARQALIHVMDQHRYLAAIAPPALQRPCTSVFPCGTAWESHVGDDMARRPDPQRARQLMKAAGYDGRPLVLLDPLDIAPLHAAALVTRDLLHEIGINLDVQAMPWSHVLTRRARKDPPFLGGWNLLVTAWSGWDIADPVSHAGLGGTAERSWIGWAASREMDRLRLLWLRAGESRERHRLVNEIQRLAVDEAMYVPFGQWVSPTAYRRSLVGVLTFPAPLLWNVYDTSRWRA